MATEAKIVISVGAAVSAAVAFAVSIAGLAWLLITFVFGEAKDDIASIRSDLSELRAFTTDGNSTGQTIDLGIRQELGELTAQLRETTQVIAGLGEKVDDLAGNVQGVDQRLASAIDRQTGFEAYVVAKLGLSADALGKLPVSWSETQSELLKSILGGPDPLRRWAGIIEQ